MAWKFDRKKISVGFLVLDNGIGFSVYTRFAIFTPKKFRFTNSKIGCALTSPICEAYSDSPHQLVGFQGPLCTKEGEGGG